jgi:hypothetical protein
VAARNRKIRHDEETRHKIQASQLINRLQDHVLGKVYLSPTQVRSAEILLRKTIPDLSATENKTEVTISYVAELPNVAQSTDEWKQQHAPTIQ